MSFYQSNIRKNINQDIYKKPIFNVKLGDKEYFGIIKSQRRMGKDLNRYMVHGIRTGDLVPKSTQFMHVVEQVRRDFSKHRGDISFQFGCIDPIRIGPVHNVKKDKKLAPRLIEKKLALNDEMRQSYGLVPSWREHMPDTTIQIDLTQGIRAMRKEYSSSGKRYINKAKKEDLHFEKATHKQWESFWEVRYTMAYDKGFHIIPKERFLALMDFLTSTKQGELFVARKGRDIVSGSVVVYRQKEIIYLYGATNRKHGNIGGHYRLTDQILKRSHDHGYNSYDLLGVAPPGNKTHYLSGVTRFKQAFGGTEVASIGNYDLVFNSMLYRTRQIIKGKG